MTEFVLNQMRQEFDEKFQKQNEILNKKTDKKSVTAELAAVADRKEQDF